MKAIAFTHNFEILYQQSLVLKYTCQLRELKVSRATGTQLTFIAVPNWHDFLSFCASTEKNCLNCAMKPTPNSEVSYLVLLFCHYSVIYRARKHKENQMITLVVHCQLPFSSSLCRRTRNGAYTGTVSLKCTKYIYGRVTEVYKSH